jgi:hypothetical protein
MKASIWEIWVKSVFDCKAADNRRNMLRLLEVTYDNLTTAFAERYGKGPFLAGALYREFYKQAQSAGLAGIGDCSVTGAAGSAASDDGV